MKRLSLYLIYFLLIIAVGLAIPAVITLVTNEFKLDVVKFGNYTFILSFFASITGGVMIVAKFAEFSRKVKKSQKDEEIKIETNDKSLFARLDYILLLSGLVLAVISYYLVA